MKYQILTIIICVVFKVGMAKELKVESFTPVESVSDTWPRDLNGVTCAAVEIPLPIDNCKFEGSVIDVQFDGTTYVVYITANTKFLRVKCPYASPLMLNFTEIYPGHNIVSGALYKMNIEMVDSPMYGKLNDIEYVDLGLPSGILWAKYNLGASASGDTGEYYSWGEIQSKNEFTAESSITYHQNMNDIGKNVKHDAATMDYGGQWRLPTMADFEELIQFCTWRWIEEKGHTGYEVVGPNNAHVFFPAAGWRVRNRLVAVEKCGNYWSSTPVEGNNEYSLGLDFSKNSINKSKRSRYYGLSIRPVAY